MTGVPANVIPPGGAAGWLVCDDDAGNRLEPLNNRLLNMIVAESGIRTVRLHMSSCMKLRRMPLRWQSCPASGRNFVRGLHTRPSSRHAKEDVRGTGDNHRERGDIRSIAQAAKWSSRECQRRL